MIGVILRRQYRVYVEQPAVNGSHGLLGTDPLAELPLDHESLMAFVTCLTARGQVVVLNPAKYLSNKTLVDIEANLIFKFD